MSHHLLDDLRVHPRHGQPRTTGMSETMEIKMLAFRVDFHKKIRLYPSRIFFTISLCFAQP